MDAKKLENFIVALLDVLPRQESVGNRYLAEMIEPAIIAAFRSGLLDDYVGANKQPCNEMRKI